MIGLSGFSDGKPKANTIMQFNRTFRHKSGRVVNYTIDTNTFAPNVIDYLLDYGLKQRIADSGTSYKDDPEGWAAQLDKAVAALRRGDVRIAVDRGDDVDREMRRIAIERIQAVSKARAATGKPALSKDRVAAFADELVVAKADELRAQATAIIAARKAERDAASQDADVLALLDGLDD